MAAKGVVQATTSLSSAGEEKEAKQLKESNDASMDNLDTFSIAQIGG